MVDTIKNNPYATPVIKLIILMLAIFTLSFFLSSEHTRMVVKKRELAELKNDLNRLDALLKTYKQNAKQLSMAERTLPKTYDDVSIVISQLEEAALQHNQNLEIQIKDSSHPEQGGVASIDVILTTTGSYRDFDTMMSAISALPYHTRLDALDISTSENGLEHKATLRVFIYDN